MASLDCLVPGFAVQLGPGVVVEAGVAGFEAVEALEEVGLGGEVDAGGGSGDAVGVGIGVDEVTFGQAHSVAEGAGFGESLDEVVSDGVLGVEVVTVVAEVGFVGGLVLAEEVGRAGVEAAFGGVCGGLALAFGGFGASGFKAVGSGGGFSGFGGHIRDRFPV